MLLQFERGDPGRPKGHALVYFRSTQAPGEVLATYLVVPPIVIDLAKYMPPMFAAKISLADMQTISAVPLPPVPEKVPSLAYVKHLAEARDDDLLALGDADPSDLQGLLALVADAAQAYHQAWQEYASRLKPPAPVQEGLSASVQSSVEEVLSGLMTEREKLAELAKLLGKLRYAVEGGDSAAQQETMQEIEVIAHLLPDKYRAGELAKAARTAGAKGRQLLELYLSRGYKLCDEDYREVERLEQQILDTEKRPDGAA